MSTDDISRFHLISPGELVTNDLGFMRGHGTYPSPAGLISSIAGTTEKVNKLVSVNPIRCKYTAEIGDVVIGRIQDIGLKRWRTDCNGKQDSVLLLSSINLPGAVQRRKSESDELSMRSFYSEGELLVAEVQMLYQDGAFGIHTRNLKYGKLVTGQLATVQPSLIRRSRTHFHTFEWGVEVILGLNGYIWIGKPRKIPDEYNLDDIYSSVLEEITPYIRDNIARTKNCIIALNYMSRIIDQNSIRKIFLASQQYPTKDIIVPEVMNEIIE